jgi:hypothetical protein
MNPKKTSLPKKNIRQANSFQRHSAKYIAQETILIVCEGETEVNYFNALKREYRLSPLMVLLSESGSAPINVVEYAISYAENHEAIDKVYCVFDRDQHSTYEQAIKRLENHKPIDRAKSTPTFTAITSVPCFEIWLLLHFEYTAKPYMQKEKISPDQILQKDLERYLPEYTKGSSMWFPKLHRNIAAALANAERLKKENLRTGSENPATEVHELIGYLLHIIRKGI